jgi:hypothetical protein
MTVPVIDNLDSLSEPPDLIHGQHHVETMTALLRFPNVPAIFFCHGWLPWEETPPKFPRILRYVAVDHTCRDRLVCEHAIPPERVRVVLNFADLNRFKTRERLPAQPKRALIYSNKMSESTGIKVVREACERAGIQLDAVGLESGESCVQPENLLGHYDIVFAKARSALEALAVGTAVVPCDVAGVGPMVTTGNLERLRQFNFGQRTLRESVSTAAIEREIARYDPEDAAEVSRLIRATADIESAVDDIVALYREVLAEHTRAGVYDADAEGRAAANYLRWVVGQIWDMNNPRPVRLRERILSVPLVGSLARSLAHKISPQSKVRVRSQ